ncbi:xenobiotic reductase [Cryptococcus deuterogattii 99/473]|uniref:Xenobiotic reductase n=1 Tax=Cryptococcus deuterogattii Ram5 TaxID=1296110 RepID=A0A0D0U3L5_9TREE|nr:xenobiotic reductase [Cryptococcus deuterogattii Ram5]KIY59434.1 xenobiotic reductase [Cryptococcus deuterogattii 99/473]
MPGVKFPTLAEPVTLGALQLDTRVIMASLTRNRSIPTTIPNEDNVKYYVQRAGPGRSGLILSEGTLIAHQGTEWENAPGIWDEEHAKGWKKVTDAVHEKGGLIVAQLWHTGRVCHPDMIEQKRSGDPVWAPSDVGARGGKFRTLPGQPGYISNPTPIPDPTYILDQYSKAAEMAKLAGFDGVELHSANGYLIEQFLSDVSNTRTDKWGGSVENRIRFGLEAAKRLIEVWGADRVGVKISPCGGYNDTYNTSGDSRLETFKTYISRLDSLGLAYIQLMVAILGDDHHGGKPQGFPHDIIGTYGPLIKKSKLVVNGNYTPESGEEVVKSGKAAAVVYGRSYVANPDFVKRIQQGLPLAELNMKGLYMPAVEGQNGSGYNDYPDAE